MTLRTAAVVSRSGVVATGVVPTATTGDTFVNTGAEIFIVKNGHVSDPTTVTVDYIATADGNAVTDPGVSVAAGTSKAFGPYPPGQYNDTLASGGVVKVTCSAVTDVLLSVIKQVF